MSYLFVNEKGASINYSENYVVVKYSDELKKKIPVESLESIYLFSSSQITSQCVAQCLKRGISISYFSKGGVYFGRLQSTGHVNVARQRKQAVLADSDFSLQLAKNIISGKIHNQEVILRRYSRNNKTERADILRRMRNSMLNIKNCGTISEIMGYEGSAARAYFDGLSCLVTPEFAFSGRSKRPPEDEFNSMLSLGYSILMNEIYSMLENHGLNPYFGFIHSDREKHPTLASDMMEEWRAVIVDSVVMSLVNGHEIHKENFYHDVDEPGYFLTREGLNIFLKKFDRKMRTIVNYLDYVDYQTSFRKSIDLQINELAKAIEAEDASLYRPIWLR